MTQAKAILEHLQQGLALTSIEAARKFGCLRLAARIYDLRHAGFDVRSHLITVGKRHISMYLLWKK